MFKKYSKFPIKKSFSILKPILTAGVARENSEVFRRALGIVAVH